jgi:hypothetical protein
MSEEAQASSVCRAVVYSQAGYGNWKAYDRPVEEVYRAAEDWRRTVGTVARPWLVWHVSDRWTQLQQRLVQSVGWVPIVGSDPRTSRPAILPGAIYVDFNARFHFDVMWMHFPLEFAHLWIEDRLAFWHSDLLCRLGTMQTLAESFAQLPQGRTSAVFATGGRRNMIRPWRFRYWELVGCTTKHASLLQFQKGAGWWQHIACHPNARGRLERILRSLVYWDHGAGIFYWRCRYGGRILAISEKSVSEGHCTSIGKNEYRLKHGNRRDKELPTELDDNYDIEAVATALGIRALLE